MWSTLGLWFFGIFLIFFLVEKTAQEADWLAKNKEKIKLQEKKENEIFSLEIIEILSFISFSKFHKKNKDNTEIFSVLFQNLGKIAHLCLSPRLTPTPVSAC